MERIIKEDTHRDYKYQIWACNDNKCPERKYYNYKIIDKEGEKHFWTGCPVIKESYSGFDFPGEAAIAAIDHINALEEGKG